MARPKKQTVEYFPHQCTHGKTMFILEEKYGNNGYAFWFKLLEQLGNTEGHYLDLNNSSIYEFLQAITRTSESLFNEILDLLAKLQAIDPELWKEKIIWSQNFVDGISSVYANRRVETPTKPNFYRQKPQPNDISTDEKPHSIVEYSIVEKSIVEEKKTPKNFGGAKNKKGRDYEFIDKLIGVFCEEYFADRKIKYELISIGKERDAIGAILKNYKEVNKEKDKNSEEVIIDFRKFFRKCMKITDEWHHLQMSPSHIRSQYQAIKQLVRTRSPVSMPDTEEVDNIPGPNSPEVIERRRRHLEAQARIAAEVQ